VTYGAAGAIALAEVTCAASVDSLNETAKEHRKCRLNDSNKGGAPLARVSDEARLSQAS
jgi:hypothetical protein